MKSKRTLLNKTAHSVRKGGRAVPARIAADRRVRRTRRVLTHALIDLVREKRYDAITIQDLLDRADVGRSTFYSHYRGKDDLLLKSFEQMLETLDQNMERDVPASSRVAPVRELFRHVGEFGTFRRALAGANMLDRLYQAGTNHLSHTIARRLAALPAGPDGGTVPRPVTAQAFAGALFALLRWWVDHDTPYSPERMDEMYHAIRLRA
jgi:AcrR family transcriptional regulator